MKPTGTNKKEITENIYQIKNNVKLFDFRSSRVRREVKRGLGMNLGSGSGPREIWSQSAISAKRAKRMKRLKSFSCPQLLISSGKKDL